MKLPSTDLKIKLSLILNFGYALFHWGMGISNSSWWFITLGAYYTLLCIMRFSVLKIGKHSSNDSSIESFAIRITGILLVIMSVCLLGVVILSVVTERGEKHNKIAMISIALYAFIKVSAAVTGLVKVNGSYSAVMKGVRNISMADALVSIFSLQRSMLVSFEGMAEGEIRLFNLLTGAAVCFTVLILGINLIGGKRIDMAKSNIAKANEKIADTVVGGYKKIEKGVVGGYKKIEKGVVGGYIKVEDKFVGTYLTRDGETVEEAKKRLKEKK